MDKLGLLTDDVWLFARAGAFDRQGRVLDYGSKDFR